MEREACARRQDRWWAVVILLVALAGRIPWRSAYAYHWDSANFALAIQHFDLTISQPHLPGYMLYIQVGRLLTGLVGDPHASLVWLSVVTGAALPALGYLLGAAWLGRRGGWATAVLLATSPLCWFQSEVAMTTIVDAALVTGTVLVGWRAIERGGRWGDVVALAALLAAITGIRPQSGVTLVPVWLYFFLRFAPPRPAKLVMGLVLAGLFSLVWAVPLLRAAGGLTEYLDLLRLKNEYVRAKTVWAGGGLEALGRNLEFVVVSCWAGLLLGGVVLVTETLMRLLGRGPPRRGPPASTVLRTGTEQPPDRWGLVAGLWVVPMVVFGVAVYYTEVLGYVLSYLPALAVLAAWALGGAGVRLEEAARVISGDRWSGRSGWGIWTMVVLAGGVNAAAFLFAPAGTGGARTGLPVTRAHLAANDRRMAACVTAIRRLGPPERVVVAHHAEYFLLGLRQFQYHLPEYRQVLLTKDPSLPGERADRYWVARGTATEFVDDLRVLRDQTMVLVVPDGGGPAAFAAVCDVASVTPVPGTEGRLFVVAGGRPAAGAGPAMSATGGHP